jgi:hypothetical protein
MKISKESWVILAIGFADLISTLVWVGRHGAGEANPLFAHYLSMGPLWFSLMKVVLLAGPIFILEWAKHRRPRFTRYASRFAIAAYLVMYGVGFYRLNHDPARQQAQLALEAEQALVEAQAGELQRYVRSYVAGRGHLPLSTFASNPVTD